MEIIGREALLEDGLWYTLPFEKDWDDAEAAGIDIGKLALRKGNFVLALFLGETVLGQVYAVGLAMSVEDIAKVRLKLKENVEIMEEGPANLSFCDPYQITWQVSGPGDEFRTAGDFAGRWLQV